jgi:hypothetical protein
MSHPIFNLGAFLEKEKVKTDGSNFTSWFCTLRFVLSPHRMGYVLDATVGFAPKTGAPKDDLAVYQTKLEDALFVQSGMLFAMESNLQKRFEKMSAFEIITDLKAVFAPQARAERYEDSEILILLYLYGRTQQCEQAHGQNVWLRPNT